MRLLVAAGCLVGLLVGCSGAVEPNAPAVTPVSIGVSEAQPAAKGLADLLAAAERVETSQTWFEVLKLPNDVYAFWEPGHSEKVNSFLVIGSDKDLLYDTGMGIGRLAATVAEVRTAEAPGERPLMVVNSHNHLDHNGGNRDFAEIWTADDDFARRRLSTGVPAGEAGGFVGYWAELTPYPGVVTPPDYDPATHAIAPYPLDQVRYLYNDDEIDLGNRSFRVLRTFSHSPDGIALYDPQDAILFGGDAFYGANYLIVDLGLLAEDLARTEALEVQWHYSSHGPQLIETMQHGRHLGIVRRMLAGEGSTGTTVFAGFELPIRSLDGVSATIAAELLLY